MHAARSKRLLGASTPAACCASHSRLLAAAPYLHDIPPFTKNSCGRLWTPRGCRRAQPGAVRRLAALEVLNFSRGRVPQRVESPMTEQARGPREPLLAQQQPAPLAGGGKRPVSLVTREELRDLNREVSGEGRGGDGGGGDGVAPHHLPAMRLCHAPPSDVCRSGGNWRKSGAASCWR